MNQQLARRLRTLEEKYAKELERDRTFTISWWTAASGHAPGLRFRPHVDPEEEPKAHDSIDQSPPVPAESTENDVDEISSTDKEEP
jgi:hypothetical protein